MLVIESSTSCAKRSSLCSRRAPKFCSRRSKENQIALAVEDLLPRAALRTFAQLQQARLTLLLETP